MEHTRQFVFSTISAPVYLFFAILLAQTQGAYVWFLNYTCSVLFKSPAQLLSEATFKTSVFVTFFPSNWIIHYYFITSGILIYYLCLQSLQKRASVSDCTHGWQHGRSLQPAGRGLPSGHTASGAQRTASSVLWDGRERDRCWHQRPTRLPGRDHQKQKHGCRTEVVFCQVSRVFLRFVYFH